MTIVRDLAGILIFRSDRLKALAARRATLSSIVFLAAGFILFVAVRNTVYAGLREYAPITEEPGLVGSLLHLNVLQAILFLALVYVPAVICLSNSIAGDGLGLTVSIEEYRTQLSAFFLLWGALLILAAPLQLLLPQFVVVGPMGISIGLLVLIVLIVLYTVWAVRELNYISTAAAIGVFTLSWTTLPLFYLLTAFLFALPFFIMIPVFYLIIQRARAYLGGRGSERSFQRHLQSLTINPQDADAQHQLGLIHLHRGNLEAAISYFEAAVRINPLADYHYYLGQAYEGRGEWTKALEQYEETYRVDPRFGQGDIFREVGKSYLQTGRVEKAIEFLQFFLEMRDSDPEGRYWLAEAHRQLGNLEEMRAQLNRILQQARSQPRFFRKERRKWIYRARILLRRP